MKCPKCGYISFDYNQVCPKCSKEISGEQDRMNLISFRPAPPSLLGALTGEADESNVGIQVDTSTEVPISSGEEVSLEDSSVMEPEEIAFDESQDLDISLEPDETGEIEGAGDIEIEPEEATTDFELEGAEQEISMDLGDLPDEKPEPEEGPAMESEPEEGGLELDLGDLSLDDSDEAGEEITFETGEISLEDSESALPDEEAEGQDISLDLGDLPDEKPEPEKPGIDLDSIALEDEDPTKDKKKDEIVLNLDDLKVNDTGELEIGIPVESPEEKSSVIEELSLDESPAEEKTSEEAGDDSGEIAIDLDEVSLGEEPVSEPADSVDDEVPLDLEDLDLELNLDEPDRDSS